MKVRKPSVHLLGILLTFVILSLTTNWLIITAAVAALLSVSIAVYLEKRAAAFPGLILVSILLPHSIGTVGLDEFYPLLFYVAVFIIPLMIYWSVVLSDEFFTNKITTAVSVSYFASVPVIFYSIVVYGGLQEYLLVSGNQGPQALVLSGCAALIYLVYDLIPFKT
ncbi:MAG: hypothetical protein R6U17_06715 [Thermoplasmata archaeon]